MAVLIVAFMVGLLMGAGAVAGFICDRYKLKTKEEWEADEVQRKARNVFVLRMGAENAKLKVALVAGEMTEEGKKIAAMTMAALETVIVSDKKVLEDCPYVFMDKPL
jgi:hypothetical protein